MIDLWESKEAEDATGGRSTCDWVASGVSIDTRTLKYGDMFVALKDVRDGHDFVADAFSKGAAVAVVSHVPKGLPKKAPLLIVDDVQSALESLGVASRRRSNAQIIAVTGSVGKTSTKEMLLITLAQQGRTHAAVASYNNHWGVPLTLARMPKDTQFGIFEIGMNRPGEITPLTQQVRPHVALITNVSEAHLEAFDSVGGIAFEKASIMEGLVDEGCAILNGDISTTEILKNVADVIGCKQIWFGNSSGNAKLISCERQEEKIHIHALINGFPLYFTLSTLGQHFALNALAAIAAIQALGGNLTKAAADLVLWTPGSGRGARKELNTSLGKIELIDDAYNANPASMIAALEMLAATKAKRRIAILGDMRELGSEADTFHAALSEHSAIKKLDKLHTVGTHMGALHKKLSQSQRGVHFAKAQDLLLHLEHLIQKDDCILVKASLGTGLKVISKAILALDYAPQQTARKEA